MTNRRLFLLLLTVAIGWVLRILPTTGFQSIGHDEGLYSRYAQQLAAVGLPGFEAILEKYISDQTGRPSVMLPPTRLTFLYPASLLVEAGTPPQRALRIISATAACATLLFTAFFLLRTAPATALPATLFLATNPLEIQLAQRSLVDSTVALVSAVAFGSLFMLLCGNRTRAWRWTLGVSLFLLPLTKESGVFIYAALFAVAILARPLRFGECDRSLLWLLFLAPLLGFLLLVLLCGNFELLFTAFLVNGAATYQTPYAIMTGDGPWHKYLVDFLMLMPAVTLLAIGGVFRVQGDSLGKAILVFFGVSLALMGQLKFGLNLRYGSIWTPLFSYLAAIQLLALGPIFTNARRSQLLVVFLALAVAANNLIQYRAVFVEARTYDPTTIQLGISQRMFLLPK